MIGIARAVSAHSISGCTNFIVGAKITARGHRQDIECQFNGFWEFDQWIT